MILIIFMSGEVHCTISEDFRRIRNELTNLLKPLEQKDYGTEIVDIGIIPIILPPEFEETGSLKERKLIKWKTYEADYRLRIDYFTFLNSDDKVKRLLLIKNIIDCIRSIGKKAKKDFYGLKLENDVLELFGVSKDDIEIPINQ